MTKVFFTVLNLSLSAGWLVLAIVILRLILRRAPRWIFPLFWGLIGLRLLLPFSIESALSLLPTAETVRRLFTNRPLLFTAVFPP